MSGAVYQLHRVMGRYLVQVIAVGVPFLSKIELIIPRSPDPITLGEDTAEGEQSMLSKLEAKARMWQWASLKPGTKVLP